MAMRLVGYVYRCDGCGAECTHPAGQPGGIIHSCSWGSRRGITDFVPTHIGSSDDPPNSGEQGQ